MENMKKEKLENLDNVKAVLFDMDGTLVDSMWLWKELDIEYLARFGHELPPTLQKEIAGMSITETAVYMKKRFNIEDSIEKMMADWNDMAMDFYEHKVPLKKGAREFLEYLKRNNIKTGIATSNSMELVKAVIKSLGIGHLLDSVHTANEVPNGKPSPDIYELVAKDLGVEHDYCLVFEDIEEGVRAGQAAGMRVCGVQDDFADEHGSNTKELADYYIMDYTELAFLN